MTLVVDDGCVRLHITDDGVGGADTAGGTGLSGLCDRVEALDGTIDDRVAARRRHRRQGADPAAAVTARTGGRFARHLEPRRAAVARTRRRRRTSRRSRARARRPRRPTSAPGAGSSGTRRSDGSPSPRGVQLAPASRVSYTRTRPSGVTRSMSAASGITNALSGSAGSSASGKPKSDGRPSAMLTQRRARVVGAIDAAVELHEQPLGARLRALDAVHAQCDLVVRRVLGQVARIQADVAALPRPAAVVGQPHAGRGDRDGEALGLSGPGDDRVQAQAPRPGLPVRPRRLLEQPAIELEGARRRHGSRTARRDRRPRTRRRPPRRS